MRSQYAAQMQYSILPQRAGLQACIQYTCTEHMCNCESHICSALCGVEVCMALNTAVCTSSVIKSVVVVWHRTLELDNDALVPFLDLSNVVVDAVLSTHATRHLCAVYLQTCMHCTWYTYSGYEVPYPVFPSPTFELYG